MTYDNIHTKWNHFENELLNILDDYEAKCWNQNEQEILRLRREENRLLAEACFRHKRELDLLAGEKVEPVAHDASATLVAIVGGSSG
jgi:hypothetical protein